MLEVIENKVKRSLMIRKINVWVMISTIATFVIALGFMYSNNLYFRALFILPIIGSYYYYHRITTYKKDLEYLPKFLYAYSKLKENGELKGNISDGEVKGSKTKIIYKDKVIYKDRIIYRDKIVNKIIEKIIEKPVEKIIYKDKIINKTKKGYTKKKNIYKNNDVFKEIEEMLAKQFYNVPLKDRAIRIYSLINQKNTDRKDLYEYEKDNK